MSNLVLPCVRPDYFLKVKRVELDKHAWKQISRRRGESPNIYVELEYGKEKMRTETIKDTLSPVFLDKQIIVTPSNKETKFKIIIVHHSRWTNTTIGHVEMYPRDIRGETSDGKAQLCITSESDAESIVGTITIHCEPIDYKSLVSQTQKQVARNINPSSHLFEVSEGLTEFIDNQNDMYQALLSLCNKLDTFVKLIDKVSEIHPYADAAWQVTRAIYSAISSQMKADVEVVDLVNDMSANVECILKIRDMKDKFDGLNNVVIQILRQITECCIFVREYMGHGFFERMTLLENRQKIDDFRSVFNQLKEHLDRGIATNTALVIARMSEKIDTIYLETCLRPERFNALHFVKCDPGTHNNVLSSLKTHLMSKSDSNIIWLYGPSGCGKSKISFSLAEYFNSISRLGAYLHFRDGSSSPGSIIATIAFKLARFDSTLGKIISDHVGRHHGELSIETQFKEYLLDPLTEGARAMNGLVVTIIDGLDKCTDKESLLKLLSSGLFSELPQNFRFLITSRWDSEIANSFLASPASIHQIFLNLSDDHVSPVIGLFDHVDSISKGSNRNYSKNKHKLFFNCFSSRLYTHNQPVSQSSLGNDYHELALLELSSMNVELKSIVLNSGSSKGFNKDIPSLDILLFENISPVLRHACLSWSFTLSNTVSFGPLSKMDATMLSQFVDEKLLTWIEVMSLMGEFDAVGPILQQAISCLKRCNNKLAIFLQDAFDLLAKYGECVSSCAYELYRSLLHPERGHSQVANHYRNSGVSNIWIETFGDRPIEGHGDSILSVAFSPDGTRIASGSRDRTIRIWDSESGKLVAGPFEGHSDWVRSVAFSPDGTRIASGSGDRTVRIWDSESGNLVAGPFKGYSGGVNSVAFSSDGTRIASGSRDRTVRNWNSEFGNLVSGPFKGRSGCIHSSHFSLDGTRIARRSVDLTVRIRDIESGKFVTGPFKEHSRCVNSVAFSPDGTRIASGSVDKTVRIWDSETGKLVAGPFQGHSGGVFSVAFSPDGSRIASGSDDRTIRIWDSESGKLVAGPFEGHTDEVNSVAFSPDGTRITSGSGDETVRIWDSESGNLIAGPFEGHSGPVNSVAFSPDGTRIASGSRDSTVRIWDVHSDPASHREQPDSSSTNSTQTSPSQPSPPVGSSELDWTLGDDGWIKGNDEEILMWIPKELRKYICPPEKSCFEMFEKTAYSLKPHFIRSSK